MSSKSIRNVSAIEIFDSRGNPTVLGRVELTDGTEARAAVPSGASTGRYEALELRDNEMNRFKGKGVRRAVENVKTRINHALKGKPIDDLSMIDRAMIELDGTEYKSNLGANATLAVSLACGRLASKIAGLPLYEFIHQAFKFSGQSVSLPTPMLNIINGGQHSDAGMDIQEYMIMPKASSFHEQVRIGSEIFHALGDVLTRRKFQTLVGDEGGYGPRLSANNQAFEIIIEASRNTNFHIGEDFNLAVDAAANSFYSAGSDKYDLALDMAKLKTDQLIDLYGQWIERYHLKSIEDGLREDDWNGWQKLTNRLGKKALIVGDDLFVTNPIRLKEGIRRKAGNAIIIKPNQIGTLTETIDCLKLAQSNHYQIVIGNRSGETIDDFIADLSVGVGAEYIKAGSVCRGERLAKYNRLLEIEMELNEWKTPNRI